MRYVDLKPYEYRKEDPTTGQMQHPINRKMLRWMAVVVLAMVSWGIIVFALDGGDWRVPFGLGVMTFVAGCAVGFTIRRPE